MTNQGINPPEKINPSHQVDQFDCGNIQLNNWLKHRAFKNEIQGASRTYVVTVENVVVAYYCLANGAIAQTLSTGKVKRNMPDPIPVMIIGRLAVAQNWQGKRIGKALLRDAILRTLQASEIAGIRAILVEAISDEAKQFYEKCGFTVSPIAPMTLMITINDAISSLI
ncbi:GNAT family N-acetyltransferase [Pseudanabaena sp. UWO311]|uniref:GNAT family N-acetyltransferase n=1 Tax=Pseudanabaena sp. UWO311 TaxID=2487337 RepID=UPI001158C633|nr:GNAT family N-acetyltransferase [Pseudanabaena sp. UWO311]TYQ24847.1 GNAT family N-acetyltransferase [Pseudanabaena sp. UWO311]